MLNETFVLQGTVIKQVPFVNANRLSTITLTLHEKKCVIKIVYAMPI